VVSGFALKVRKRLPGFNLDTGWRSDGGFTVLFGYSGAGKSLTLSMLTGTMRPDSGRVTFGDEVLVDTERGIFVPPQARGFGYVSQSAELFPHLSVVRNVAFGLHRLPRLERAERIAEMLEAFGLNYLADKLPRELSGGQKQRAALARALAPRPRALLLDEPLSALDLPVRVEMRALLRQVQLAENIPVVMVTHDLYEAATLADSLVVYGGDGVVQTGTAAELIGDPGTPEIRRLLHAMELPPSVLTPRVLTDAA
jgi:ABC-type sulfate/molybdate transport systems ATPase subunit